MRCGGPKRCGAASGLRSAARRYLRPRLPAKRPHGPGGRDVDNTLNPYEIILRPLVTEKSTALSGANKYIFEVDIRANKPQIKNAVEKAFNVHVTTVNVMVMKGKPAGGRMMRRKTSWKSDWKKAIVTLVAEDKIELFEGV